MGSKKTLSGAIVDTEPPAPPRSVVHGTHFESSGEEMADARPNAHEESQGANTPAHRRKPHERGRTHEHRQGTRSRARLRPRRRRPARPGRGARAIHGVDRTRLRGRDELSLQKPLRARATCAASGRRPARPSSSPCSTSPNARRPTRRGREKSRATPTAGTTTSS